MKRNLVYFASGVVVSLFLTTTQKIHAMDEIDNLTKNLKKQATLTESPNETNESLQEIEKSLAEAKKAKRKHEQGDICKGDNCHRCENHQKRVSVLTEQRKNLQTQISQSQSKGMSQTEEKKRKEKPNSHSKEKLGDSLQIPSLKKDISPKMASSHLDKKEEITGTPKQLQTKSLKTNTDPLPQNKLAEEMDDQGSDDKPLTLEESLREQRVVATIKQKKHQKSNKCKGEGCDTCIELEKQIESLAKAQSKIVNQEEDKKEKAEPKSHLKIKPEESVQTPPSKKDKSLLTPNSAPSRLAKEKKKEDIISTPTHFPTQSQEVKTDPVSLKHKSTLEEIDEEVVYNNQTKVSKIFLALDKREYISKKAHILLIDFMQEYVAKKSSTIDITGLSARARFYLINSIINFKLRFRNNEVYWIKEKASFKNKGGEKIEYDEYSDLRPTTFQIGNSNDKFFKYKLTSAYTTSKPGGGRLYGILSENSADKYDQILERIKKYKDNLDQYSELFIKQKKDGLPIYRKNKDGVLLEERSRFLNGFNLLLDYEVARRSVVGDMHLTFPAVNYIIPIIQNLSNFAFIECCFNNLFTGNDRKNSAMKLMQEETKLAWPQKKGLIREGLKYLHAEDEQSQEVYSLSEEEGMSS